jgi:hypothetical protein
MSEHQHPVGSHKGVPHRAVPEKHVEDEPPPVLGTWGRVYAFAMFELAVVIGLFYWFTVAFRP